MNAWVVVTSMMFRTQRNVRSQKLLKVPLIAALPKTCNEATGLARLLFKLSGSAMLAISDGIEAPTNTLAKLESTYALYMVGTGAALRGAGEEI